MRKRREIVDFILRLVKVKWQVAWEEGWMFWVCVKKKMLVGGCVECLRRVGDLRCCVVERKWLERKKRGYLSSKRRARGSRSTSHVVR